MAAVRVAGRAAMRVVGRMVVVTAGEKVEARAVGMREQDGKVV